jgi:resuscitation-promoting factor RpfB
MGWGRHVAGAVRPWFQRRWVVVTAVLVLAFFGAGALSGCDDSISKGSAGSDSTQKSTVPRVTGLAGERAKRKLEGAGLVAVVAREVPSARPRGTVLRQLKAAGASVRAGSSVGLVLAAPYPMVPGTAGMAQAAATQRLRSAGFQVRVTQEVVTSGRNGVVLRQTPVGSRRAKPHSLVTLVVANVVRPVVAPPPPANCTPGYSPCLAPAYDYDCVGGSGDGPQYTGFVYVTGSDPYDLDRDGDGLACES